MPAAAITEPAQTLSCGIAVGLASDLASIQAPDGSLMPVDKLGPGLVQHSTCAGRVLVHWVGAGFDSWLDSDDVRSLGSDAHLVTVGKYDRHEVCKQVRHKVDANIGLRHNWAVELRSNNIVRVLRCDGAAWTFTRNRIFDGIQTYWPQPPDDDDAEALTVAELSIR